MIGAASEIDVASASGGGSFTVRHWATPSAETTTTSSRIDSGEICFVFSEPFPTPAAALAAARTAAAEQRLPGHTETIEWEDEKGHWHTETAAGSDRPDTDVEDTN